MEEKIYDVLILGAGPAGLSAAIYAGRAKRSVLIIDKGIDGGQIALTHTIENYPGQMPDGESGQALTERMAQQARRFGCERVTDMISTFETDGELKRLKGAKGSYLGRCLIICTGALTRRIGCKNEENYIGRGVSYCAVCDAAFFEGLDIYSVGGSGTALEEALYLSRFAKRLFIVHSGDRLSGSKSLLERVNGTDNIRILLNTQITELGGEELLSEISFTDTRTHEKHTVTADPTDGMFGCFCFTGEKTTGLFDQILELENGFIRTNEKMETGIAGVYAAGDVRVTPLRQVVTACADGAIAAMSCEKYLNRLQ